MGNEIYRPSPRKNYDASSGKTKLFEFAANQITGWRNSQEDRYTCLPNFDQDLSFFAVYDGHGGEEVVQYLKNFLHLFIFKELEVTKDIELALFLGFLNCDSSLREITDVEYHLIENDLEKEFEVPDKAERRRILFQAAGTSGKNEVQEELRAAIASACIKELPSISFLTQAPVVDSDESDEEYQIGDEDINFLQEDSSDGGNSPSDSESADDDMEIAEECKENVGSSTKEDKTIGAAGSSAEEKKEKGKQQHSEDEKDLNKKIGINCGSTATVVLINSNKIFIAHVGDSRCVASIKKNAVELTEDHRPNDKEELRRILNAGGSVSEGRIQNDIDMSRAFGDFRYKAEDGPHQILSVEPSLYAMDINEEVDFIIIASDGIWNTMETSDVVQYVSRRLDKENLEMQDLIGELFEELLPDGITDDGSGCDNLTMIIIKFIKTEDFSEESPVCFYEQYNYNYPPVNKTKDSKEQRSTNMKTDINSNEPNSSTTENSEEVKKRRTEKDDVKEKDLTPKPVIEAQRGQEKNPSESSSQLDRNLRTTVVKNCSCHLGSKNQSISLNHAKNMCSILKSLNHVENSLREFCVNVEQSFQNFNSNITAVRTRVEKEILWARAQTLPTRSDEDVQVMSVRPPPIHPQAVNVVEIDSDDSKSEECDRAAMPSSDMQVDPADSTKEEKIPVHDRGVESPESPVSCTNNEDKIPVQDRAVGNKVLESRTKEEEKNSDSSKETFNNFVHSLESNR